MKRLVVCVLAASALLAPTVAVRAAATPIRLTADGTVASIDKNEFVNGGEDATDFHLIIAGKFTAVPKSDKMPNVTGGGGRPLVGNGTADFDGGTVPRNGKLTVSFMSDAAKNKPRGYFTPFGDPGRLVDSVAPNGFGVAFVPTGNDFVATLDITNTDFVSLTGSLSVYVNDGLDHFNLDEFDTLFNALTVLSLPSYSFAQDAGITGITTTLTADQYLLVLGQGDTGDGTGSHAFAVAFSPTPVPEPSTLALLLGGTVLGAMRRMRHGRRRSGSKR
jgi:hypothetical protein